MANPFLMTDEDMSSTINDLNSNPFLMQDAEDDNDYAADNPFMAQASNPFAAFGDENVVTTPTQDYNLGTSDTYSDSNSFLKSETNEMVITSSDVQDHPIDSAMTFFGTTITDMDDADDAFTKPTGLVIQPNSAFDDPMVYSSEDELKDKRLPPPRPVPPSQTTQDLILSVADQLDQTSSHLLNRIPVTRTPSPVSMRDLHSPSPTPEFGDLLDVSEQLPPDLINQNDGFGYGSVESKAADNPFIVQEELPKEEQARPLPPARPTPPRPTPPRLPSLPQTETNAISQSQAPRPAPIQEPQTEPDLFDMFGTGEQQKTPQPPAPKSNQDILNLFSTPKPLIPASQPDLLSGDILSMDNEQDFSVKIPVLGSQVSSVSSLSSISSSVTADNTAQGAPIPQRPPAPGIPTPSQATTKPQRPAPPPLPKVPPHPVVTDNIVSTPDNEPNADSNVTNVVAKQVTPQQEKENILDEVDATEVSMQQSPVNSTPVSDHVVTTTAHSEHSDEHMDTSGVTPIPSVNPFASPESEAMDVIQPLATVPAPTPQPFTSSDGFGQADEFDAFAAKFDSVKKEESSLLDGFDVATNHSSTEQGKCQFTEGMNKNLSKINSLLINSLGTE